MNVYMYRNRAQHRRMPATTIVHNPIRKSNKFSNKSRNVLIDFKSNIIPYEWGEEGGWSKFEPHAN